MLDHALKVITQNYTPLSDVSLSDVKSYCKVIEVKKGEVLVKEGEYSDNLYFVIEGGVRGYYLKKRKDHYRLVRI